MSKKLLRCLGDDLLPKAVDVEAARTEREALHAYLPPLRDDLERLGSLTERARLSRHLVHRTEAELLCGDASHALEALAEAEALLAVDEREAPILLVDARRAWANILLGDPAAAVDTLRRILRVEDVTVRGWSDQLLLWLAAAHHALGEREACLEALTIAAGILDAEPRRNDTLVRAALARMQD